MNYTPTYLGEISLDEETLAHYGVKGMKWGKRLRSALKNNPISKRRRKNKYVASHLAKDVMDGRRKIRVVATKAHKGKLNPYAFEDEFGKMTDALVGSTNRYVSTISKYGRKDSKYPKVPSESRSQPEHTTLKEFGKALDNEERKSYYFKRKNKR